MWSTKDNPLVKRVWTADLIINDLLGNCGDCLSLSGSTDLFWTYRGFELLSAKDD